MAQTIEEIKEQYASFQEELQEIDQEIEGAITGDVTIGATSVSKTANWRLQRLVWSAMSFLQQSLWDLFRVEIQEIANNAPKNNSRWLAEEVKMFQYGDPLLFNADTRQYYYAVIDVAKQIIARVAVVDTFGLSTIKVAKDGPIALSSAELAAFTSFVRQIQPTGSNINVISEAADLVHLPIEIFYDAIIPLATVQLNVEAAVIEYLETLTFNGTFYTINLVDAIQKVEGVIDVIPGAFKGWPAEATPLTGDFDRKYQPLSGYLDIYDLSPLDEVITYTKNE